MNNTTDWVAYEQQKLISHSSGVWKFKIEALVWSHSWEDLLSSFSWCLLTVSSLGERGQESLWNFFYKALIPFVRALPLSISQRPLLCHQFWSFNMNLGFQHEFEGYINIETVADVLGVRQHKYFRKREQHMPLANAQWCTETVTSTLGLWAR